MDVDDLVVEWVTHLDVRRRILAELQRLRTEVKELRRIRGTARRMIAIRDKKIEQLAADLEHAHGEIAYLNGAKEEE